ncbi:MAG: 30S ribosomal protein S2 [Calditrichaeota bacterium]|nr:30S ribosomal protein S2 [Calditrichota bacterium]
MDNPAPASASSIPSGDVAALGTPPLVSGPRVSVEQLLLAGAHFGHLTQRWNPKMKRYIFMARNGIYLIDLNLTQSLLDAACRAISAVAAQGEDVLFIGTKKQAREVVELQARRCGSPFVTFRWLGGTLTNFSTIRKSLRTMENYEKMASDGTYEKITKKEQLQIEKDKGKLIRTLGGLRDMRRLPGAVFIVDTNREDIAVKEARKLNIPIFAIVDTNVDPDLVDYPIPANDDAYKSIGLITHALADAIMEGRQLYRDSRPQVSEESGEGESSERDRSRRQRPRRRSRGEGDRRPRDRESGGRHEGPEGAQ